MIRGDNFWMMDEDETYKLELVGGTHDKQDTGGHDEQPILGVGKDCTETPLKKRHGEDHTMVGV